MIIFLFKSISLYSPKYRKLDDPESPNSSNVEQNLGTPAKTRRIWRPARVGDLSATDFSTPRRAQKHCTLMKNVIYEQRKKIKNLQLQNKRLHRKVETLNDLIKDLRRKNLISECAAQTLVV